MKRIVILLLLAAAPAFSQNGGSGYTRYGLGDLRYFESERSVGMGDAGIGVVSPVSIDQNNPAAWTAILRTRFALSTVYEGISTSDDASSAYYSQMFFSGAAVAIPVSTGNGIAISVGMTPISRIKYDVLIPPVSGTTFSTEYIGDGGLSTAYIGGSWRPVATVNVGAKLDYYFGTLNYTTKQIFPTSDFASSNLQRQSELRGLGGSFGAIWTGLGNVLGISDQVSVGFVASTTSYLNATDVRFYTYNAGATAVLDTLTLPDFKIRFPYRLGGGVAYSNERVLFAADAVYQNWRDVVDASGVTLRDSYRIGAGGEITPKREPAAPYTQRMTYRFGGYYDHSYYEIRGQSIDETGFTAGVGLPMYGDTHVQVGIGMGWRGTTDLGLQKDRILRISFTLSGSELWFVRPEQE